ncbi:hypothetical protein D3C81_1980650 [compost metagenome]
MKAGARELRHPDLGALGIAMEFDQGAVDAQRTGVADAVADAQLGAFGRAGSPGQADGFHELFDRLNTAIHS